ncbi:MAG: DUF6551 family protein, partial [Nocardioidaceae bacterium]
MAYLPGIAQRAKIEWGWVAQIAADFDPDELDHPTVSARDNCYFVADGMHRVEALKQIGWGDQQIQCWTYTGLDETGEADLFLGLNNRRAVSALDRFSSAITAGRTVETDINQIVAEADLAISGQKTGIKAVATLRKVYERSGPHALSRALAILRDAYGTAGLDGPVIEGLGLVTARYNGDLDDTELTRRLQAAPGGVTGLTSA